LIFKPSVQNNQESPIEVFREEDILQLKNNTLPKGIIVFEDLFNKRDQLRIGKILNSLKNFK